MPLILPPPAKRPPLPFRKGSAEERAEARSFLSSSPPLRSFFSSQRLEKEKRKGKQVLEFASHLLLLLSYITRAAREYAQRSVASPTILSSRSSSHGFIASFRELTRPSRFLSPSFIYARNTGVTNPRWKKAEDRFIRLERGCERGWRRR